MPAIPAIIMAGASIASSALSKPRKSAAQKQQEALQNDLLAQQKQGSELGYSYAKQFLPEAQDYLSTTGNFYKGLLTGDASKVNELLAPEVNSYNKSVGAAERNLLAFAPRGASTAANLWDLNFKKAGDLLNMRLGARQTGATGTQNVGALFGNLGNQALATAGGTAAGAGNQLLGMQQLRTQQDALSYQRNYDLGQSMGSILSGLFKPGGPLGNLGKKSQTATSLGGLE